jgi:secondary thiamine-phosphate synthase enzyme
MQVSTHKLTVPTSGNTHVIDINAKVAQSVKDSGLQSGIVTISVVGSTASITTTESEPGLLNHDLKAFYQRIAPDDGHYAHEATWNDDNGHSHVRASSLGPSITIPLIDGQLALGTWQQIVLIDFDTRPRSREVIVQILG